MTVEYKVRSVKRYIVTKYVSEENTGSTEQIGEYPNGASADLVADALVALDKSNGVDSLRVREGLSLGECISGKRCE